MRKGILAFCSLVLAAGIASANTVDSSTLWFQGTLSYDGDTGAYTGTIGATAGYYYVAGGPGTVYDDVDERWENPDGTAAVGGFDVYGKEGGTAYVQGMDPDNWTIGSDHDAYSESGPWGSWYDPDCADWNEYQLELTADHWYLRYASTWESPMSGTMDWTTMYAAETDLGTQERPDGYPPHGGHGGSLAQGGGAGAWDWDCGWGVEVIPLELPGFTVSVTVVDDGSQYTGMGTPTEYEVEVSLTPAPIPAPGALLLGVLGVGLVGVVRRVRRRK